MHTEAQESLGSQRIHQPPPEMGSWQELLDFGLFWGSQAEWKWAILNQHPPTHLGFPGGVVVKNSPAYPRDTRVVGSIPGSGRSPGEGNGNPLQYSCLENPMDRGAWRATDHGVAKSWTRRTRLHCLLIHGRNSAPPRPAECTFQLTGPVCNRSLRGHSCSMSLLIFLT